MQRGPRDVRNRKPATTRRDMNRTGDCPSRNLHEPKTTPLGKRLRRRSAERQARNRGTSPGPRQVIVPLEVCTSREHTHWTDGSAAGQPKGKPETGLRPLIDPRGSYSSTHTPCTVIFLKAVRRYANTLLTCRQKNKWTIHSGSCLEARLMKKSAQVRS